jgi:hypothetical protein
MAGLGGEISTVQFSAVAVTAAQDFFTLISSSTKSLIVHGIFLGQHTEVGDAQDEFLQIRVRRGQTVSGSGGSTPTPVVLNPSAAAASYTAHTNDTTIANTGTIVILHSDAIAIRGGYQLWLPPECRWVCPAASRLTIELVGTPADSITMDGTIYVEEVG